MSRSSTGFGMAAGVTVLFNTVLTCCKDSYAPLAAWMGSWTGHNWTTQGIADVALFFALGLIFSKMRWSAAADTGRVIGFIVAATLAAGLGLLGWFAFF